MTKKRSKCLFILFSIILVVCLIACFVNFTYPFAVKGNYYSYSNFVSNVKMGEDIGNSLRVIYDTAVPDGEDTTNSTELRLSTLRDLKEIVQSEGYKDVSTNLYGENQICITIGNLLTDEDKDTILGLIGAPGAISFSTDSSKENVFATRKDIKDVTYGAGVGSDGSKGYSVIIEFKDEVKALVEEKGQSTIYVNLGEEQFEWSYGLEGGYLQMSSSAFESSLDAQTFANQIKVCMLDLELTKVSGAMITPTYGAGANIILGVIAIVIVVGLFVYLILKYKHIGWVACFNMLFAIVISLFLIQSIPLAHINFGGMLAFMIGMVLIVDSYIAIFEDAKKHYNHGTQFHISFKLAFKENLFKTLILNSILVLTGFACLFMPALSIQSFGWVMLIVPAVSVICSQALMRLFVKMYLALNNSDGKKCNFHKGGKNA